MLIFAQNLITRQVKYIVRQIHREKHKTQTQSTINNVNPNKEYWLGNTKKLENLRFEVLPRLFTFEKYN